MIELFCDKIHSQQCFITHNQFNIAEQDTVLAAEISADAQMLSRLLDDGIGIMEVIPWETG